MTTTDSILPVTCNVAATIRAPSGSYLVDFTCTFTFFDEDVLHHVHAHVAPQVQEMLDRLFPGSQTSTHEGRLQ
jgi:hypothetical protein